LLLGKVGDRDANEDAVESAAVRRGEELSDACEEGVRA